MRNEVKRWVWAMIALMGMLLCYTSCDDKSREESRPDNEYLVDAEILVVDKEGNVVSETPLKSDVSLRSAKTEVESEKGIITGLGLFKASEVAKVKVTAKRGYLYKGMYFKYNGGYDKRRYPINRSSATLWSSIDITVVGNITVVAMFEEAGDYEFYATPSKLVLQGNENDDSITGEIEITSTRTVNGKTSFVLFTRDGRVYDSGRVSYTWRKGENKKFSITFKQVDSEKTLTIPVEVVITETPKPVYNFSATPTKLVLSGKDTDSSLSGKITVTSTKTLSGVTTDVGYNTSKGSKSGKTVTVTWSKGESKSFNVTLTQDESGKTLTIPVEVVITETPKPVYNFSATPTKLVLSGKDTDSSLSGKITVTSTKTLSGVTTDVGYNTSKGSKSGKTVTVTWSKGESKSFNVTLTQDESGKTLTIPVEVSITQTGVDIVIE